MDIFGILTSIKGKVLDAANFDILRSAYVLQNQNIEQLKSNNEAITENNQLLRERCAKLEEEIVRLKAENANLHSEQDNGNTAKNDYTPTGISLQILQLYQKVDKSLLFDEQVASMIKHSKLEIEVAFSELSENKIVSWGIVGDRGIGYYLTTHGKRLVLNLNS